MVGSLRSISRAQGFFIFLPVLFLLFSFASIALRSQGRRSIVALREDVGGDASLFAALGELSGGGTKLQLKDFHRVEVKEGRVIWEVRAKNASYFSRDSVSHVNDASVVVYRTNSSSVRIQSKAAKLHTDGESLSTAELEGTVVVQFDQSLRVETELAIYDAARRIITAPGAVFISGEGYWLSGKGLIMEIDAGTIRLSEEVRSQFEPKAQIPKGVAAGLKR